MANENKTATENTTPENTTEQHRVATAAMIDMYEAYLAELDRIEAGQAAREELS